jgi:ribosome-binding factor A
MSTDRIKRVDALLRREIAEAIPKEMANEQIDLARLMISRVETAPNLRSARVYVSISAPDEEEHGRIFRALLRHRANLQRRINHDLKIKYTPKLEFKDDSSIGHGDHVLDVLSHLDIPEEGHDYGIDPDAYDLHGHEEENE